MARRKALALQPPANTQPPPNEDLNPVILTLLPSKGQKRPRTRSSLLRSLEDNSAAASVAPKRKKNKNPKTAKTRGREELPVIDLTVDESSFDCSFDQGSKPGPEEYKSADVSAISTPEKPAPIGVDPTNQKLRNSKGRGRLSELVSLEDTPQLKPAAREPPQGDVPFELNSSPIKKIQTEMVPRLGKKKSVHSNILSSPTKKRKSVAFSDNIASDIIEEYSNMDVEPQLNTPRRSILKVAQIELVSPLDPCNSSMWVKSPQRAQVHSPSNPQFWQPGTIIQLLCKSQDLPQLLEGCLDVLEDAAFDKKFEVYATLNLICKTNDVITLKELLLGEDSVWIAHVEANTEFKRSNPTQYMKLLCAYAQRDIGLLESSLFVKSEAPRLTAPSNNPFDSRILNQVLKLIANLLALPTLNAAISVEDIRSFYSHTCDILVKPNIPKSLVAPYLSIIKDCNISSKRRKLVFEATADPLLEKLLFALLNMRNFVSSSLINEKFIALRNLIQNFPNVLAKNFHLWFPGFLLNLCDLSFVLYAKVIGTGVTTLLEVARTYLDVQDVCSVTRRVLESPIPMESKSWISENLLSINSYPQTLTIDYVAENLKELIWHGHHKYAMDIWVGLTLLIGNIPGGLENWKHLNEWLQVHKDCFNEKSFLAKETALTSWKVIIYKICFHELRDIKALIPISVNSPVKLNPGSASRHTPNWELALRPKIKLLIHPFLCINTTEIRNEIVDSFHRVFVSILYNLFNFHQKSNSRFFQVCWLRIVVPVMMNFYFKSKSSTEYMHLLGSDVVLGLLSPPANSSEKVPNSIRCLSNEPIRIAEVHPFNPRWLHSGFERVFPVLQLLFELEHIPIDTKLTGLCSFLNSIKLILKKEVQPSNPTFDLIESLHIPLQLIFDTHEMTYEVTFKLILNLIDAFGAANLVPSDASTKSVFDVVLRQSSKSFSDHQMNAILSMLYGAVGEKKSLLFLRLLNDVNVEIKREDVASYIGECLNNRKNAKFTLQEMMIVSNIFKTLDQNYAGVAKRLIQQIVLTKPEEFESLIQQLHVAMWSSQIFIFFLNLMYDAPYDHLKRAILSLIEKRLQELEMVEPILVYLLEQKSTVEILNLKDLVITKLKPLLPSHEALKQLWSSYVKEYSGDMTSLDKILVSAFRQNVAVEDLINDRWDQLPEFRAEWAAKIGLDCSESSTSGAYPIAAEKLDNMLEKEFLNTLTLQLEIEKAEEHDEIVNAEASGHESSERTEDIDSTNSLAESSHGDLNAVNVNQIVISSSDESSLDMNSRDVVANSADSSADESFAKSDLQTKSEMESTHQGNQAARRELTPSQLQVAIIKPSPEIHDDETEKIDSSEEKKTSEEELSLVLVQNSLELEKSNALDVNSAVVCEAAGLLGKLSKLMSEVGDADIVDLSESSQRILETQMLELMLRMRKRS